MTLPLLLQPMGFHIKELADGWTKEVLLRVETPVPSRDELR